ncbi:YheC/YheD family protein [Alteribacter aurantiacus]|uniref:YheC/YheD family endospore coat-associated protein n=1 Tax=Alteribacter aurantiacus TaxID=254410 RepID=UPI0004110B44|nr:YheC/YheD family protein [Alteribacter aurantiacus]
MFVTIGSTNKANIVVVSREIFDHFGFLDNEVIQVQIGALQVDVHIEKSSQVNEADVLLPAPLMRINLPEFVKYELKYNEGVLNIGPLVGVLISKRTVSRLKNSSYRSIWEAPVKEFIEESGLVYLFSEEGINFKSKTVKGFYYDGGWKEEVLPMPSAIFRRAEVKKKTIRRLKKATKGKVFNSFTMNKWKLYKSLKKEGFNKTPETVFLSELSQVASMIDRHHSIYLKPMNANFGLGCFNLFKTEEGYGLITFRGVKHTSETLDELLKVFQRQKLRKRYILQQSVQSYLGNKLIDHRVILQKNEHKKWVNTGIVSRVGLRGMIITNAVSGLYYGLEGIQESLGLDVDETKALYEKLVTTCICACEIVESKGRHVGDVGIDVIIDANLNIWILEINSMQTYKLVTRAKSEIKHRILSTPLKYLRALAR